MESNRESMERFAHDVCVHVLEKFGIFKTPDDARKHNEYLRHDFLPLISKSVVSFAFWVRSDFQNSLEDICKASYQCDDHIKWIFEDYLFLNNKFSDRHWTENVCLSLALCTEYTQFAKAKLFTTSLNKLVVGWGEYFEKHLKVHFEENDGFLSLCNYLELSQVNQLADFQEAFISEHCIDYGAIECTEGLAKECIEKHGFNISLENTIFGIKKSEYLKECSLEKKEVESNNQPGVDLLADSEQKQLSISDAGKESKSEACSEETETETESESDDSSSYSTESEDIASQDDSSEKSDSEPLKNDLLGIPPHEEVLREIDPFFVENIKPPPKPRTPPKSDDCEPRPCCPSPELREEIERTLTKCEKNMASLRRMLYGSGMVARPRRRRSKKAPTNVNMPQDPEGLV